MSASEYTIIDDGSLACSGRIDVELSASGWNTDTTYSNRNCGFSVCFAVELAAEAEAKRFCK